MKTASDEGKLGVIDRTQTQRALFLAALFLSGSTRPLAAAEDYIWLEGEAAQTDFKVNNAGWGNKQFLSGEKWLHVSVDADKVEQTLPEQGVVLHYPFEVKQAGGYEIWDRLGFEFARSTFEWRLDGGEWKTVTPEELTTDLMEIDFFCEVAWLKLDDRQLEPGKHELEIRLPKTRDGQGKWQRVLYAGDALCIHRGRFFPNGKYKPDESNSEPIDREAAEHVFELPAAARERSSLALEGLWEVCRHDEQVPGEVAAPMKDMPERSFWRGIPIPSDKNTSRPDLIFAHRLWYRTKVKVPEACAGKSFYLVFPQNNLNTTVFVNGVYCGFDKNPFARVQIDISRAVKPGLNEVRIGLRDAWYARTYNPKNPLLLRKTFNLPKKFFNDGFQRLAYPVWAHPESGILVTPELVCAGPAYASDVFCKPSVKNNTLALDVTITNGRGEAISGELLCEAVNADGGQKASFDTQPNNEPQTFTIEPPLVGKDFTLRLADWEKLPGKAQVTGLDNLRLKARRSAEFYEKVRPMLNVGGLMEYPRGPGGMVLCNLLFQAVGKEQSPANFAKKQTVITTILRNLQAPFSGGKTLIAGAGLKYERLDIAKHATQYRDEKGWFGDKRFTFKEMPTGVSKFAGVPYNVYEFPTSPVPTVLMLKGNGLPNADKLPDAIRDITVNRKADALFFLHTARLDSRRNGQEVKEKKQYETLRYVVHYDDGETIAVPIYAEIDIDDYRQESPRALPGAQIAGTRPWEGTGLTAVAYSKQWNNPRPEVAIKSIDMVYGSQPRGVPALIAITTATAADRSQ